MADESEKPPVTDSRFPGFNPEVEESKAAAEKDAAYKAALEAAGLPFVTPPPTYTYRCSACGGLFEKPSDPCLHCGGPGTMTALEKQGV